MCNGGGKGTQAIEEGIFVCESAVSGHPCRPREEEEAEGRGGDKGFLVVFRKERSKRPTWVAVPGVIMIPITERRDGKDNVFDPRHRSLAVQRPNRGKGYIQSEGNVTANERTADESDVEGDVCVPQPAQRHSRRRECIDDVMLKHCEVIYREKVPT